MNNNDRESFYYIIKKTKELKKIYYDIHDNIEFLQSRIHFFDPFAKELRKIDQEYLSNEMAELEELCATINIQNDVIQEIYEKLSKMADEIQRRKKIEYYNKIQRGKRT